MSVNVGNGSNADDATESAPRVSLRGWCRPPARAGIVAQAWLGRWQEKYPKLTDWVEEHIGSTLTFYGCRRCTTGT